MAERRRRANELDGRTWTRHSISIWSDLKKSPEEMALAHPAMFPAALPARLIECFTTAEDNRVLDPFAEEDDATEEGRGHLHHEL